MGAKLTVENLSISYGGKTKALDNLSIEFSFEQINVILGQNGSGKSSLMRVLAGVQPTHSGDIRLNGVDRGYDSKDFNSRLIYLAEDFPLPGYLTLNEFSMIYQDLYKEFNKSVFARILSIGEVSEKKRTGQLSRGQQTLAQFALAIASNVDVLMIDEVTAVLDPYLRRHVIEELVTHQKARQNLVILSTNIATEFYGDDLNIMILKNGLLVTKGPFSGLKTQFYKINSKFVDDISKSKMARIFRGDSDITYIGQRNEFLFTQNLLVRENSQSVTLDDVFVYFSDRGMK